MIPIKFHDDCITMGTASGVDDKVNKCHALFCQQEDGTKEFIICWQLTWLERLKILFTGKIWHGIMSDHTIQPQYLSADPLFKEN